MIRFESVSDTERSQSAFSWGPVFCYSMHPSILMIRDLLDLKNLFCGSGVTLLKGAHCVPSEGDKEFDHTDFTYEVNLLNPASYTIIEVFWQGTTLSKLI